MKLYHVSNNEIDKIYVIKQLNTPEDKPKGFWYSPNNEWENWLRREYESIQKKEVYLVEVNRTTLDNPDPTKVLSIKTSNDWDRFTIKYGYPIYFNRRMIGIHINWFEVSKEFAGIEIIPFQNAKTIFVTLSKSSKKLLKEKFPNIEYNTVFWYSSWDISSGCVWGKGGITKCEWIKEILPENKKHFEELIYD